MTAVLGLFTIILVLFLASVLVLLVAIDRQRRRHIARLRRVQRDAALGGPKLPSQPARKAAQNGLFRQIEGQLAQTSLRVSLNELLVQVAVAVLGLYAALVLALGV
jgi:tight adherence protein B